MELTWLDPARLDERDVAGAVAVQEAAREVDLPFFPGVLRGRFAARLRVGYDGDPPQVAVARTNPGGPVIGLIQLSIPRWDNTHLADVLVVVDPHHRRRGAGRELFEAAVARVHAQGRRLVCASSFDPPAAAFLEAMGLKRAFVEVLRRLDLAGNGWPAGMAEPAGDRYELVRLAGALPEELLPKMVELFESINDAPTGELAIEDEVFPPERIRATERAYLAAGRRVYRVVARERATGRLAGHTVVAVGAEQPWYGSQQDTSVVRDHRGHRLGLRLKSEMLRWLREAEPQLRLIDTGNAADNQHMISINDQLGYEVLATAEEWQRHL